MELPLSDPAHGVESISGELCRERAGVARGVIEVPIPAKAIEHDLSNSVAIDAVAILVAEPQGDPIDHVERVRSVHGHRADPASRAQDDLFTCLGNGLLVNVR